MTRDEIVAMRKEAVQHVDRLRKLGDHSAEAPDIRALAERQLLIIDDILERRR